MVAFDNCGASVAGVVSIAEVLGLGILGKMRTLNKFLRGCHRR